MNKIEISQKIKSLIPSKGLFDSKEWRISPEPFYISKEVVKYLERLGDILFKFQQTSDIIYRRSKSGSLPNWISSNLDKNKPKSLLKLGLNSNVSESFPRIIRPDLILTESGLIATEIDSVPGGIGLTSWLQNVYSDVSNFQIIGGKEGIKNGFSSIFNKNEADILVSKESSMYKPEMEWLASKLEGKWNVYDTDNYNVKPNKNIYRLFELFDLNNISISKEIEQLIIKRKLNLTSPFKPWLEEKMWLSIFWSHSLKSTWKRHLRESNWIELSRIFPMSWIVNKEISPYYATIDKLNAMSFSEIKSFSKKNRELVLKMSGFNEKAWGSKSVTIGNDSSKEEWSRAVDEAIKNCDTSPYILQKFYNAKTIKHPWFNTESNKIEIMKGKVRLCPYYFIKSSNNKVTLGGILATICPNDKKIIHGMKDAILVPCSTS